MIVFDNFWKTLKAKNISQYELVNKYGISKGLLDSLRKNKSLTTYSLDKLCTILDCRIEDIATFVPEKSMKQSDFRPMQGRDIR